MHPGLIGGIVGSVIGVLGGIIGTYASIRNANSPQERRYMIRCAIGLFVGIATFLASLFLLPPPYRWLLWIPYSIALPLSIMATNRGISRIRAEAAGGRG
jgi:uncharacterized membrane protein